MKRLAILTSLLACTTFTSFGWGKLGHRAIATCAVAKLNSTAKNALQNILANSATPEINTPENAAVWPDDIKPGHTLSGSKGGKAFNTEFPHNDNWHFANYPLEGTYTLDGTFSTNYDVVHEINKCIDVLEHRPGAPAMSDAQALAFLIHLVGDLHQPLHVACGYYRLDSEQIVHLVRDPGHASGLPHDAGGNKLVWGNPGKYQPEFHMFWDDNLVSANGSVNKTLNQKIFSNWSNVKLAPRPADYHHWAQAWANDSIAVADRVYVDASGLEGTPGIDHKHNNEKVVTIDIDLDEESYKEAHAADALEQLTKGARDLCDLLNQIQWTTQIAGGAPSTHSHSHGPH
jgi:hypothetical protein